MELRDKTVVVTGAAGGIGSALCRAFEAEGADVTGIDLPEFDVGSEAGVLAAIESVGTPINVWFSNAGVPGPQGGPEGDDAGWDEAWRVNVMQHVWASRALLPEMTERGEGYLVNTASAAGLLTQVSAAAYSATKAAAVSLAEWLAITYNDAGVRVSCLCPQAVQTSMLDIAMEEPAGAAALRAGGIMEPDDVAAVVVDAMRDERFLILPHEEVARFMAIKAAKPERWLEAMKELVRTERGA
jgi:NAD(P)-dependent dehydrogenase (short-subunit alcohol dehydrogenase family)